MRGNRLIRKYPPPRDQLGYLIALRSLIGCYPTIRIDSKELKDFSVVMARQFDLYQIDGAGAG